jgi:hypothetical protein
LNRAAWLDEGSAGLLRLFYPRPVIIAFLLLFSVPRMLLAQEPPIPLPGQETQQDNKSSRKNLEWKFSGYGENTLNAEYLRAERRGIVLNNSRFRLNLAAIVSPHFDFGMTLVGFLNSGKTKVNLFEYMPSASPSVPVAPELFEHEFENDLYLQEAFGTLYTGGFKLRVGRHKFYSGTGFAFNPIDLFNRKDPLDPTYEVDGLDSVLASYELPNQSEIQGVVRLGNDFDTTDYQARLKTHVQGWDLAFQYTNHTRRRVDWESLNTEETLSRGESFSSFERDFDWRLVAGEFSGELWGVAFRGEGGYAFVDAPDEIGTLVKAGKSHARFLIGVDYTFDSQVYLIAEYMHLGQGRTEASEITLNDRMAYFTGEILTIDRDTLFTGASYPITPLAELSLYGIIGVNDPSMILNPWLTWSLRPALKLSVSGALPLGNQESQSGNFGVAGFVRLRYSF